MDADVYVAAARYPLTVLHRPDPDAHTLDDLFQYEERVDGWTVCGLPFKESELWMPVKRQESDRTCAACCDPDWEPDDAQEELW